MRPILLFLAGAVAAAGSMLVWTALVPDPKTGELAELRKAGDAQKAEIDRQHLEITAQTGAINRLQIRQTSAPSPSATPVPPKANALASLASLIDTPAMRKMMAAQRAGMIEDNYADLIGKFHFTPEERAQFLALVSAKESIDMDLGMKLLKAPPGERQQLVTQQKAAKENADADIREFFNNDQDFATYTEYTGQQAQRYELKALQPGLKAIDQPLTPAQETSLMGVLQSTRKAFHFSASQGDPTLSADAQARMLEEQAQLQQQVAAGAAAILTPQQLEVFRKTQARQLQMMKTGFEMSRAMLDH
ncbi:MAG: hypothetical protein PHC88_04790 [Terrimicrobiaceae bacterium]|nr:hypothetical protein [Terrimicrobiaceae bacterium]